MSRSKNKGPYSRKHNTISLKKNEIIELPRSIEITPTLVGLTVKGYSGKKFENIDILEEMIGFKIGEFLPTRSKFEFKKKKRK